MSQLEKQIYKAADGSIEVAIGKGKYEVILFMFKRIVDQR